ncbi:hypothetical protein HPB51_005969 [Rhipicephalus microplus]|uniref:RRM domain-containing protein n=1 Tax=Rhipicephalus microplus TaxID=6941 RepID=A0A9J6EF89_RHIMP|nr:hypothetical protein HPB51_005969 [Rhipicephalus microplus]
MAGNNLDNLGTFCALPETKTYANMVSKNSVPISSAGFTSPSPAAPFGGAPTSGTGHVPASTGHSGRGFGGEPLSGGLPPRPDQRGGPRPQQQTRAPRASLPPPTKRAESGRNENALSSDDGTAPPPLRSSVKPQYPDNQQVFVGNLPHSITEEQVLKRFEEFGHVLEFRMNSRSTSKMTAGGKAVPLRPLVLAKFSTASAASSRVCSLLARDPRVAHRVMSFA